MNEIMSRESGHAGANWYDVKQARRYRSLFAEFLRSNGMQCSDATAAQKILWLETFINPHFGKRHNTLRNMANALREIGEGSVDDVRSEHQLVLDYLLQLRNSARVKIPRDPSAAMPGNVFRRVLGTFDCSKSRGARDKTMLLFGWWGGLAPICMSGLRRSSVELAGDHLVLTWRPSHAQYFRKMIIPSAPNPETCAVRAFEHWRSMSKMPDDPGVYLFPALYKERIRDWYQAPNAPSTTMSLALVGALRRIGESDRGFNFTSIRREHARRCRNALGEAMALHRCGFRHPSSLAHMLRGEPDWKNQPRSVLDSDDVSSQSRDDVFANGGNFLANVPTSRE